MSAVDRLPRPRMTGRTRVWDRWLAAALVVAALFSACSGSGGDADDGSVGPFELIVHPEFVQGMYPGVPVTVLVAVADDSAGSGEVALTADFSHGSATVAPSGVSTGQIAQVTFTADPVVDEQEEALTVEGTRGSAESVADRRIVVMPGADDREAIARDLLALFLARLQQDRPDLRITEQSAFDGSVVAPRLLVVSHYLFQNDEYELGLSWHIMVAPDDWSELYVRPKDSLTPVTAFRLSSWSMALAGENVEFTEVEPPAQIVR